MGTAIHIGEIVGVQFAPAEPRVDVKVADSTLSFSATPELVETALTLRGQTVKLLEDEGETPRILRIEPADSVITDAIEKHIFQRWDGLLRELAK